MAVENFIIDLIEALLADRELGLTEQSIRFYEKGSVPGEDDEALDSHIRWKNARYFNRDSSVLLDSILMVELSLGEDRAEHVSFQMEELSGIYRNDGPDGLLSTVASSLKEYRANGNKHLEVIDHLEEYEVIKDHLILRPLNYNDNRQVLKSGVCRRVGDIALALYVSLGHTRQGSSSNVLSTMVKREIFSHWEAENEEAVLDRALRNTMRLQPPVFCSTSFPKMELKRTQFMEDEGVKINFNLPMAPVLSTEQEVNGAIAAFYPGVLERIYRMTGGEDFYLVFTSIYDVHIHPVNGNVKLKMMRDCLADMNRQMNNRQELLSRRIYRYSGKDKGLTVV